MKTDQIKNAFSLLELSEEDREGIWKKIESDSSGIRTGRTEKSLQGRQKSHPKAPASFFGKRAVQAAACMLLLFATFGIANGMTGGRIVKQMTRLWKPDAESKKIMTDMTDYHLRLGTVYAPELIECTEDRIIFCGLFGLVIYDRRENRVAGTIDLESIGCDNFNTDHIRTIGFVQKDTLNLWNVSGDFEIGTKPPYDDAEEWVEKGILKSRVTGKCYSYDLNACRSLPENKIVSLKPAQTGTASKDLLKQWKNCYGKNLKDTSEVFQGSAFIRNDQMHSEYSLAGQKKNGQGKISCLVIDGTGSVQNPDDGEEYSVCLYQKNRKTKKVTKETLNIKVSAKNSRAEQFTDHETESTASADQNSIGENTHPDESAGEEAEGKLPAYGYQGTSKIKKALVDFFLTDPASYEGYYQDKKINPYGRIDTGISDVVLPLIEIAGIIKEKKEIRVLGCFRWNGYVLSGRTLHEGDKGGGGEGMACLTKTDTGYRVRKIVHPGDGAYYGKDLLKFCDGDKKLLGKLGELSYKKIELKTLKRYVKQNHLDIRFFKSFGRDKVRLK